MHQAWDKQINQYVRFIHPMKTAGSSISEWMLSHYAGVTKWTHQTWSSVPPPTERTLVFTVFRNPWDRMESIYWAVGRFLNKTPMSLTQAEWDKGFEYFVDRLADSSSTSEMVHINQQGFTIDARLSQRAHWPDKYPFQVLNFDNLNDDWIQLWKQFDIKPDALPHCKYFPHPESLHTARTKSIVEKIWADDVEFFTSRQNLYPVER